MANKLKFQLTDKLPICPYCEKELSIINKYIDGFVTQDIVYSCPYCDKILSITRDS